MNRPTPREALDYEIASLDADIQQMARFASIMTHEDAAIFRKLADELRDMANRVTRVAA